MQKQNDSKDDIGDDIFYTIKLISKQWKNVNIVNEYCGSVLSLKTS